ncbi:hypothetical protein H1R20_g15502, partial [Candolleomyces eurysporus]
MFSFRPIGRDFGDAVDDPSPQPTYPSSTGSGDGKISSADIASAINLSLLACGLVINCDMNRSLFPAVLEGTPSMPIDNSATVETVSCPTLPTMEQPHGYSLRPASSLKPTRRAQGLTS